MSEYFVIHFENGEYILKIHEATLSQKPMTDAQLKAYYDLRTKHQNEVQNLLESFV